MFKIIIFFMFSLIMLKISCPDIETMPQSSSVIAGDPFVDCDAEGR